MILNQKKLSQWTSIIIIVMIIWVWAQVFLQQKSDFNRDTGSGVMTVNSASTPLNQQSLADFHIFGSPQVLTETPLMAGQTNLQLVLSGTMSSDSQELGLAYIANKQGVQKKFKVGEKVFDLAMLKEIHPDHVILSRNGKDEILSLSEPRDPSIHTSTHGHVHSSEREKQNQAKKNQYLKHFNTPQNQNWQQIMSQQKFDAGKISSIVGNVNLMTDQAGQIKGLKVSSLAQGDLLTKFGLKSNDVITAVNGNAVSAGNMLSIRKTLEQNPNATVTVKRNGKTQNIQINLSDL